MSEQKTWYFYSAFVAAIACIMKYVGDTNRNLSELQDFWYIPLPLAVICYLTAVKKGNSTDAAPNDEPDTTEPESE